MIIWKETVATGFGGNPGEVKFNIRDGFTLIRGPNGAGKSTGFAALCWSLYGKTDKGVRSGAVVHWGSKTASVTSEFEVKGARITVFRQHGPNRLQINGRSVDQEDIDVLFGGYSMFLSSVVFGQAGTKFLSVRPGEQQEMVGSIIGIERWDAFLDEAEKSLKSSKTKLDQARHSLENATDSLEEIRDIIVEDTRKIRLEKLREEFLLARGKIREARKIRILRPEIPEQKFPEKEKMLEVTAQIPGIRREIRSLEAEIVSAKDGGTCSQCGSVLKDAADILEHIKLVRIKIEESNLRMGALERDLDRLEEPVTAENLNNRSEMKKYHDQISNNRLVEEKLRRLISDRDSILNRIGETEDEPDPRSGLNKKIGRQKKIVETLKEQVDKIGGETRTSQEVFESVSSLRRSSLSGALEMISERINISLSELGLNGWSVDFDTAALTGTGSVKKSLTTTITPPGPNKPAPLLSYSGGETQRLLLASSFAFVDLASALGFGWNLEVYDECTRGVDSSGIVQYFKILEKRSKVYSKSIFAIEHHPACADFAHSIIDVVPGKGWE